MEALNCVFKTQLLPSGGVMNVVLSRIHPISDLLCFSAQRLDERMVRFRILPSESDPLEMVLWLVSRPQATLKD